MIPETTENKGFSKRALLPFVGDFSKSIFGIATENDIRVITVVYPIRNGHFKMADCKSSKR